MSKQLEGLDPRRTKWWASGSVELVDDVELGACLLFPPRAPGTAHGRFPDWFSKDYKPPVRAGGSPIPPSDLCEYDEPAEVDDREAFRQFCELFQGQGAGNTAEKFAERREGEVLAFAKKYGPLGIGKEWGAWQNPEPIAEWWVWGQSFLAVVSASSSLAARTLPSNADWTLLVGEPPQDLDTCRRELQLRLQYWIHLAEFQNRVKLAIDPKERDLRTLDPALCAWPLFGALVRRTVFHCIGASDPRLWKCDECGALHTRKRTPHPDQLKYCPECRARRVPARNSARRKRSLN